MEEYYGVPLFDRLGKKVALTEAGKILAEATRHIMDSATVAEQRIDDLKGLQGGKLALGASFDLGIYLLPGILAAFRDRYPAVEVTVDISLSAKVVTKVLANKLDVGLISNAVHDPRLFAREFMTDELIVIVPGNHPWARKKRIRPQDLPGEPFIVAARGAGIRAVVEERLKEKRIVLTNIVDFGNIEGIKRAVEAGFGDFNSAQKCSRARDRGGIAQSRFPRRF